MSAVELDAYLTTTPSDAPESFTSFQRDVAHDPKLMRAYTLPEPQPLPDAVRAWQLHRSTFAKVVASHLAEPRVAEPLGPVNTLLLVKDVCASCDVDDYVFARGRLAVVGSWSTLASTSTKKKTTAKKTTAKKTTAKKTTAKKTTAKKTTAKKRR